MGIWTEDELQSQNAMKVAWWTTVEALGKAPTLLYIFAFPLIPFLNSASTASPRWKA